MIESPKKQLVAFLDLLGFRKTFELIKRQKTLKGRAQVFKNSHRNFQKYISKITSDLIKSLQIARELGGWG